MVSNKFLTNKSHTIIGYDKGKQRVNTLLGGCFASTPLMMQSSLGRDQPLEL